MDLYHVGYVVDDIEKAMAGLSATAGRTWSEIRPRPLRVQVDDDPTVIEVELLAAYSRPGPPFVELIQDVRGGIWSGGAHGGARLDHLGYWERDLPGRVAALRAAGATQLVHAVDDDGNPTRFAYLRAPGGGPWLELVDESVEPELMAWIEGRS
ncbi:VOC family protein [Pseudonocardia sp. N23]|uniref:VOC family protein n=1 Tax=Pseudonocardia sp. N23 TaxID=1987376 RepID=UPI000BFD2592|nr:VOC family protein [Pseudonocardia sp. N23]GAY08334.1 hypothetical protein TOK_1889 [Pseudonocardia sp. N23]